MTQTIRSIAVYCGSATPSDPRYIELARSVGAELAGRGITVVYGGGKLGLMGALADGALAAGGEVIGVIPEAMVSREVANEDCTRLHVVANMHERKALFTELADAFLTLPGGVGTMDELWEAISWAQLGYHTSPVGLLNVAGFYDQLIGFNRQMVEAGFIRPQHAGIMIHDDSIEGLLDQMAAYQPHETIFAMKAARL